jgi:hypothetical protein
MNTQTSEQPAQVQTTKEMFKLYKENEEINNHMENAVMLVNAFGSKLEKIRIAEIANDHEKQGFLSMDQSRESYELSGKYYKLLIQPTKKQVKEFKATDSFLPILIYKFPLGNCGGITDTAKNIYIPCEEGHVKFSEIKNRNELDLVFYEEQRGADYWALKPILQDSRKSLMSGGNLATCSDSRCKRIYHVHDREE